MTVKHVLNVSIDVFSALNLVCVVAARKDFFSSQANVFALALADILILRIGSAVLVINLVLLVLVR